MKRNNGKMKKAMAGVMATTMMLSLAACGNKETAEVPADENKALANTDQAKNGDLTDTIEDAMGLSTNTDADKDETVYVIADAKGKGTKTIVDEWLKNPDKKNTLDDVSSLTDIENVKGDETFEQNGDKVTWEANGNPIYYQGTTNQEAPVGVNVKYYMDDKEVEPDDIAGKSGKVKIRFEYTNTAKSGDVYTPFVMATGLVLDGSNFSNVSVSNGKVVSDGDKFIVVGMGMPGLNESLDIDGLDTTFPDYFEITADTSDFELDMSVTVASANFLGTDSDKELDIDDAIDEVDDLSGQYSSGMDALVEGIQEYTDGVGQVKDGVDQLDSGAASLQSGAKTLSTSVTDKLVPGVDQVASGAGQVSNGVSQVSDGAATLSSGASQLQKGVATAKTQVDTFKDSVDGQQSSIQQLVAGAAQLDEGVNGNSAKNIPSIDEKLLGSIPANYESMDAATQQQAGSAVAATVDAYMQSADEQAKIGSAIYTGVKAADGSALTTGLVSKEQVASDVGGAIKTDIMAKVAEIQKAAEEVKETPAAVSNGTTAVMNDIAAELEANGVSAETIAVITADGNFQSQIGSELGTVYATAASDTLTSLQTQLGDPTVFASTNETVTAKIQAASNSAAAQAATDAANVAAVKATNLTLTSVRSGVTASATNGDLKTLKDGAAALDAGVQALPNGFTSISNGLGQVSNALGEGDSTTTIGGGAKAVADGAATLSSSVTNQLLPGAQSLASGTGTLQVGMITLKTGANSLSSGAGQLKSGTAELKSGVDTLDSNSAALNDGAAELQDATQQILDKLDSAESDATKLVDNINEMKSAASAYQSFGGMNSDMKGNVKFVIKTAAVTTDSKN